MVMLLELSRQRGMHLRYFTRFTGDAIAQNHWRDAVRLKKCSGSCEARMGSGDHAVFNTGEYCVVRL